MKKKILYIMTGILLAIQFIQPDRSNPPVEPGRTIDAFVTIPENVRAKLKDACFDCHSHETVWPWYSYIAPVSWLISRDVALGRSELNFSNWAKYSRGRAGEKLAQMAEQVASKEMPLSIYPPLHSKARLTDDERKMISDWAEKESEVQSEMAEQGNND